MEIKFNVDLKTIKKCFALLDVDIPSDEEIKSKFENLTVDLAQETDGDIKQAELGFVALAIRKAYEE